MSISLGVSHRARGVGVQSSSQSGTSVASGSSWHTDMTGVVLRIECHIVKQVDQDKKPEPAMQPQCLRQHALTRW